MNIQRKKLSGASLFASDPEVMGGRLVFRGTRIPVEVLFENLADRMSLDDILDAYPGLPRENIRNVPWPGAIPGIATLIRATCYLVTTGV